MVKTLAGKTKLALADGQSITKKTYPNAPNVRAKTPPKPPAVSKRSQASSKTHLSKESTINLNKPVSTQSKRNEKSIAADAKSKSSQQKGAQSKEATAVDGGTKESTTEASLRTSGNWIHVSLLCLLLF